MIEHRGGINTRLQRFVRHDEQPGQVLVGRPIAGGAPERLESVAGDVFPREERDIEEPDGEAAEDVSIPSPAAKLRPGPPAHISCQASRN